MRTRFLPVAALVLAFPLALAAAEPHASFSATEHDFGQARRGDRVSWSLTLKNDGDATLEVRGVRFSMPGMTAKLPGRLAPGAQGTIAIEWATDHVQGAVRGVATIETNDPASRSATLTMKGRVHGPLDVEPIAEVFVSAFADEDVRRVVTLTSNQPRPVTLAIASPPSDRTVAELEAVEPGKRWRLTVRASPKAPPGRYEEDLRVTSDDPAIGTVRIPVHLFVKADVYANPDDLDFGEVSISRLTTQAGVASLLEQFALVKKRRGELRLASVRSSVPALQPRVTPPSGAAGTFRIDVGFAPALAPGSLDGTITVETDDPKFPRVTIRTRGRLVE